jgi:GH15 family glucan-1,4-alpha-glucosidase
VVAMMEALGRRLWVKAGAGGLARYERDYYFRVDDDFDKVPGNPWIICTLWLADWYIAIAKNEAEMRGALDLLEWACRCALPTGVLPEQVHPHTLQPLSVAPLTWSHSQFVLTVANYCEKLAALSAPQE